MTVHRRSVDKEGSTVSFHRMNARSRPGRAPTSKDVAALAGVAQSTVSYVINGKPVAPETRRRVEEAMRKLRYQPNAGARTLRTARTRVVALVVHLGAQADAAETVPYIDTVIEEARKRDYDVVVSMAREGAAGLTRLARRSICDAVVMMDVEIHDDRLLAAADLGVPVVLVGRPSNSLGLDVVDFDTWRTAELLVDELAATGHRHVGMLDQPGDDAGKFRFISDFNDGARAAAERHGVPIDIVPIADDRAETVAAVADRLLAEQHDRLGLIARTPRTTQVLMHLLQLRGLEVGVDLSLVSRCTDDQALAYAHPVTNVSPRPREVSMRAMELLFDRLQEPATPPRLEIIEPGAVVRRASTARFVADQ